MAADKTQLIKHTLKKVQNKNERTNNFRSKK